MDWQDDHSTGNDAIDADHQMWFQLFNEFVRAVASEVESTQIWTLFQRLDEYALWHFAREEEVLEQRGLPRETWKKHLEEHGEYRARVAVLKARHARGEPNMSADIMAFLQDWLMNHILHSDRKAFEEVKQRATRKSTVAAY